MSCNRMIGPFYCCSIVQGDCLELLKLLPDGSVDAVITDPPYGISLKTNYSTLPSGGKDYPRVHGDDQPFDPSPFLKFRKVILWGANNFAASLPARNGWIIWDKRYGYEPDAFFGDAEMAWTNLAGGVRVVRKGWASPLDRQSEGRYHPTQKPIEVMQWCIDRAGWDNGGPTEKTPLETILDPYAGSGTTLVAAKKLGRHFLGFEISPEYCEIARKRIALVEAQPNLFAPKPEQQPLEGL